MNEYRRKYHYRIDQNRDGTFTLSRATLFPKGWMESGSKVIKSADLDALRLKLQDSGFIRSWPPSYGKADVVEYWDEPIN